MATIQTVMGPIDSARFGTALPHEHVLCDFIGAEKTGRDRWEADEVVAAMLPFLLQIKERGVAGFVDCTPAYIGRDPRVLRTLAEKTGLHIVTNTGYYGGAADKFVPRHAYSESPAQLAARWAEEWTNGIEGTGIKPGFIKIGVDAVSDITGKLSEIDSKLVVAAALASRETGLSVTCHTGGGPAGFAAAALFRESRGIPDRFVVAHADGHGREYNEKVIALGANISFDGIGSRSLEDQLKIVLPMLEDAADKVLLSMDRGWWNVGEPGGGKIRDYNYLTDVFLPALRDRGIHYDKIKRLSVKNPARIFAR